MALFTGQQAHAGVTGRGSTPSTRAVPRRQGDGAFHRSAGARGCDGARFHAVYPRGPTSAGGWRFSPVSRRTRVYRARFHAVHLRCLAPAGGIARLHRSAGARGCDGARFHAVYPRGPTSAGRMALFTGQQAHAGVTGRGSTPSTRAVPRRQGGWRFSPVSRRTRV